MWPSGQRRRPVKPFVKAYASSNLAAFNKVFLRLKMSASSKSNLGESTSHSGRVLSIGDGVAVVSGLFSAKAGELVLFASGEKGMVLNLERSVVKVVLFGSERSVKQGSLVFRTRKIVSVKSGSFLLGRVVDGAGNAIDGQPLQTLSENAADSPVDIKAPGIIVRQSVFEPLQTGVKAVDTMIPIGRGQRELIIGDRQTGKTAIAVDAMINQAKTINNMLSVPSVYSIYVAVGQRRSTVVNLVEALSEYGAEESLAMDYTVIVAATSSDSAALQYLAPYTGCTIGE